jgi:hypothetical protein
MNMRIRCGIDPLFRLFFFLGLVLLSRSCSSLGCLSLLSGEILAVGYPVRMLNVCQKKFKVGTGQHFQWIDGFTT